MPLLALKKGAPTGVNGDEQQRTREEAYTRFKRYMSQNANHIYFIRFCYKRYILQNPNPSYQQLATDRQTVELCLTWYPHQYYTLAREMQLLPDLFTKALKMFETPFAHTWMQCFLHKESELFATFRQAIIQSNGQTLIYMTRGIDEHSCDTINRSPYELYRNPYRAIQFVEEEFQHTWRTNFYEREVFVKYIEEKVWPFEDSQFQTFYAALPYAVAEHSPDNPLGPNVSDLHLQEVRNAAGKQLTSANCFMYFYRYNFARALLSILTHAFIGQEEDQFSTFDEFVQSSLGANMRFMLLNELTMTKQIRDDIGQRESKGIKEFDELIDLAGPTWNYATKFLLNAFTTDEATRKAYEETTELHWEACLIAFLENLENLKTMMPVCNSSYLWSITTVGNPKRFLPLFRANYEMLYLFCKEVYRHNAGHRKGVAMFKFADWNHIEPYRHRGNEEEIDKLPLYKHVVFECLGWLCEDEERLHPSDIRAIMRTAVPEEIEDNALDQQQVENAAFFYDWINMIQELVKDEVELYAENHIVAVRTRRQQYYYKRKNPKYNPELREKLDALNSAYEQPLTLVARYRMAVDKMDMFKEFEAEGFRLVDEKEEERSFLTDHVKRQRTTTTEAMLRDALVSKMCELRL